ncbi:MAG: carboxymuconolactone decarboxylase family protein [Planctomycetes bacterium]|nr:carboxymuconolactone decarboxylase family protein [Planctomycetota bacterium]
MNAHTRPAWRALLDAFVAANTSDGAVTERALRRSLRAGLPASAAQEAMRMVHLFGGFPRTLNALEALQRAFAATGVKPAKASVDAIRAAAGKRAFQTIYESNAGAVTAYLRGLDPPVARWIADYAYARVLSRPELTLRERELLAVAALAATGQNKQLISHALGARRAGATDAEIRAALRAGLRAIAKDARGRALASLKRVFPWKTNK